MASFSFRRLGLVPSLVVALVPLWMAGACSTDVSSLFGGAGGAGTDASTGTDATTGSTDASTTTTGGSTTATGSSSTGAPATCGNGAVEPPEQCDGQDLGAFTCVDGGFSKPDGAACDDNCQIGYQGCTPSCGDGTPEPGEECDDNNTMDGDGCSSLCRNEVDPCGAPQQVALANGSTTFQGMIAGQDFHQAATCAGAGPEAVFEVTPASDGYLTAWLTNAGTSFDAVIYARATCGGEEIVCNDNEGGNSRGGDVISFPVSAGVPVFVFVDAFNFVPGSFTLELDLSSGEDCDDPVPITIELDGDVTVIGNTGNHSSDAISSPDCTNAGAAADIVYDVHFANGGGERRVSSSASFNSVLHARTTCDDIQSELDCSSIPASNDASIQFSGEDAFVWIDGITGQVGAYQLDFN